MIRFDNVVNVEVAEDKVKPHIHLNDLGDRDPLRIEPLRFPFDSHKKVVEIHHPVNTIVHRSVPPGIYTTIKGVTVVCEGKGSGVMKPVQKDDGSFVHNEKERINELPVMTARHEKTSEIKALR